MKIDKLECNSHNLLPSAPSIELSQAGLDLQGLENDVDNSSQRISLATNTLADLRLQADDLRNQAGDLKEKATKLQEANVEGEGQEGGGG